MLEAILLMAALTLAPPFTDEAVVQRGRPVPVWGTAAPGAEVHVELACHEASTLASKDGAWRVMLDALPAGGPHELRVASGGETITRRDVFAGEVWLCSGQSNMQWPLRDVADPGAAIERMATLEGVRLFRVPKPGEADPEMPWSKVVWQAPATKTVESFSAVALYFAEELRRSPAMQGVPIGLIDASVGGTRIEAWMPARVLARDFAGEDTRDSFFDWKPSSMFESMVAPLAPLGLAGVLWYQGESNAGTETLYRRLLAAHMQAWRDSLEAPELPFLVAQLPAYAPRFADGYFTGIRSAQQAVVDADPRAWLAITIDTDDGFDLHPKQKSEVGRRLGLLARRFTLCEDINAEGPRPASIDFDEAGATITFETAAPPLVLRPHARGSGFELASSDGPFRRAEARLLDERTVRVESPLVSSPKELRHAWEGSPPVSLLDSGGLPAAPFRTDARPMASFEMAPQPAPWEIDAGAWCLRLSGEGWIESITVQGEPFIAFDRPAAPGGYFTSFWGPSRMWRVERTGPSQLEMQGDACALSLEFAQDGVAMLLRNKWSDPLSFRVDLRPGVTMAQDGDGVLLSQGKARVRVEGLFPAVGEGMHALVRELADGESASARIRFLGEEDAR